MKPAQKYGVTPIQLLVLRCLAEEPGLGLNELSDRIQLASSTASGIVNRMVNAGLVASERSAEDRRVVSLKPTERGLSLWREIWETRIDHLTPLLEVSEADQENLLRIHAQIVNILQNMREESVHESCSNTHL